MKNNMEINNDQQSNHINRLSIYIGSAVALLIISFFLVLYFSAPDDQNKFSSINEEMSTSVSHVINQINNLSNDLSLIEKISDHIENEKKIDIKKVKLFLKNYKNSLITINTIKEDIRNNLKVNDSIKLNILEIIEHLNESSRIAFNRFNQIPIASPLNINKKELYVVSKFGLRNHPIHKSTKMHNGIDLRASVGTQVIASASGKVINSGKRGGYGYSCEIQHKYGYSTIYAHMVRLVVSKGSWVNKGDEVGFVGNTGLSEAPHLHYEIRIENQAINPIGYIFDGMTLTNYSKFILK